MSADDCPPAMAVLVAHRAQVMAEVERQFSAGMINADERWSLRDKVNTVFLELMSAVRRNARRETP